MTGTFHERIVNGEFNLDLLVAAMELVAGIVIGIVEAISHGGRGEGEGQGDSDNELLHDGSPSVEAGAVVERRLVSRVDMKRDGLPGAGPLGPCCCELLAVAPIATKSL